MAQSERHKRIRARVIARVIPEAVQRFLEKNEDYGDGSDEFGPKAQVVDLGRKYKKIKSAIWDEQPLIGEPLQEVIDDMIGHLFLLRETLSHPSAYVGEEKEFTAAQWFDHYKKVIEGLL